MSIQGASVVITHHIKKGKEHEYEEWLEEIRRVCESTTGFVDWQIIRPIPDVTFVYTVIIRFNTVAALKQWMESNERKSLIHRVSRLFAKEDHYVVNSGLDFLFAPVDEKQQAPVRWKQYLVTWSAIFPLSLIIPLLVIPLLGKAGFASNRYLNSFFVSGIVVFLIVYVIMPRYTRLIKRWLYS